MHFARVASLVAVLGTTACGSTPTGLSSEQLPPDTPFALSISVVRSPVDQGESPGFVFTNSSNVDLGYNLCIDGYLEKHTLRGWVAVDRPNFPCALLLAVVRAGTSTPAEYATSYAAGPGEYRLRVRFSILTGNSPDPVIRRSGGFSLH